METFKLVKNDVGRYQQTTEELNNISSAIHAVLDDSEINFDFLSDWLRNSRFSTFYSNLCAFVKVGNNIIVARQASPSENFCSYFCVSRSNFVIFLDQWKKIDAEKPDEITIMESGGEVTITC